MPWSSIPQCPTVSGGQGRDPVLPFRFSKLMFPNPKELHMLEVNDVIFFEKWKNIWISQELHIHHWGFDWILRGNVYLVSFFSENSMPGLNKIQRGASYDIGWTWFIHVPDVPVGCDTLCSCSRPTKNCISKTSPGWRFWNLGKLRSGIGVHHRIPSETRGWSQVMQQRSLTTI